MYYIGLPRRSIRFPILPLLVFLLAIPRAGLEAYGQASPQRSPAETVREFYKTMREKRFREAFALSIYKPALDGLTNDEFEELRPDFEKMAGAIPEKIEVNGEQTSGDVATVFVKVPTTDTAAEASPVTLIRETGVWIIGDRESAEVVKKAGKRFFFEARIETHHNEVQSMLQRISLAQIAYASQHDNRFSGLPALIAAGLVPKDIETPDTTGYTFHITIANDGKSWTAGAEPIRYGRSGRLSYLLDSSGIRSADVGGKPLILPEGKN
jgi:hypothetical protein